MDDDGHDLDEAVRTFATSIESALAQLRADLPASPTEPAVPPRLDPTQPAEATRPVELAIEDPAPVRDRARPRRGEGIARLAITVVIAIVVALATAVTVGPLLLPYRTYHVRSGSMEPAIPTGALVVLAEVDAGDVEVGDIITFDRPDGADGRVTHRVVEIVPDGGQQAFLTKGDANAGPDPWRVPATGTQLRHLFEVPLLGYVFSWLSPLPARVALLSVPALALVWLLWSGRRGTREVGA